MYARIVELPYYKKGELIENESKIKFEKIAEAIGIEDYEYNDDPNEVKDYISLVSNDKGETYFAQIRYKANSINSPLKEEISFSKSYGEFSVRDYVELVCIICSGFFEDLNKNRLGEFVSKGYYGLSNENDFEHDGVVFTIDRDIHDKVTVTLKLKEEESEDEEA